MLISKRSFLNVTRYMLPSAAIKRMGAKKNTQDSEVNRMLKIKVERL
jgi:hypothetical protein